MNSGILIGSDLQKLSFIKRIAFGASCCERLLPNYLAFSLMEDWGDFITLRKALDLIWIGLIDETRRVDLDKMSLEALVELAPETEDFTTIFTSLAGDAVASVVYTIGAFQHEDESTDKLLLVLQVVQNSVFEYLASVNEPNSQPHVEDSDFEQSLFQYPLMATEVQHQRKDLLLLRENVTLSHELISKLKEDSSNSGIQPIKRGMVKNREK